MAKQNRPMRKNWFDQNAERKGKNFLDNFDREFVRDGAKARAVDNILRDISDGILTMTDLTTERLFNINLLNAMNTVFNNRYANITRMLNGINTMIYIDVWNRNREYLAKFAEARGREYTLSQLDAEQKKFMDCPDPYYYLPHGFESMKGVSEDPYITNMKIALTKYQKMYIDLIECIRQVLFSLDINNGAVDPTIVEKMAMAIKEVTSTRLDRVRFLPLDFDTFISSLL